MGHQLLAYADYMSLLRNNIDTINKNTETLSDASKEVGLEVNVEKTKYMLVPHHHNIGQNHDIKAANTLFEKCITVQIYGNDSNKSLIQEEIEFW
jgi:hypothetical protein